MALDKFKASPLPNPPAQYDPQYLRQVIRVLEAYFSQLDSRAANNAQQYSADRFIGGSFSGTDITATSLDVTTLNAVAADIDTQVSDSIFADYLNTYAHRNGAQISNQIMANMVYADFLHGDGRFISTPYNQFQSSVDQTAASVAVAYALKLEITDFANGIYMAGANDTEITFSKAGIYRITYSLQFKNTANDGQTIDIWFRYNGADVVDSNTRFFIPPRKSSTDPSFVVAVTSYTGTAQNDDDYIEIMWRVSDTAVILEHLPAVTASPGVTPAIPATPSAIVQADFISAQFPPVTRVAPLPVFGFGQVGDISVLTR
jgi:hypothetical protein